jgi:hypothetical protein
MRVERFSNATLQNIAFLLAAVVVLANTVSAIYGLDNINLIQAFNLDEARYVAKMKVSLQQATLDPDMFYSYGNLYDTVAYYWITLLGHFGWTIDTPLVGFVLRLVSLLASVATFLALFAFGGVFRLPKAVAAACALTFLTMPDFVRFSAMMHPDTLQTFFVIVSLGIAFARPSFSGAMVAALFAGLAFSTKYVGAVALPFCFLPFALSTLAREELTVRNVMRLFWPGLALIGIFLAVFALTNPYAVADHHSFIAGFIWQLKYSSTGHGVVEPRNPLLWLPPLLNQFGAIGVIYLFAGLLLSLGFALGHLWRDGWRAVCGNNLARNELILVGYLLLTLVHLAISIHDREARFLYHIVPFMIVLSASALLRTAGLLMKSSRSWAPPTLASLLLLFCLGQIAADLKVQGLASDKPESENIKFGNSIAQQYPADTKIIADAYTYLPPTMTNVTYTNMLTDDMIQRLDPDLIIVNRGATGAYVWKAPDTKLSERKLVRDDRFAATPEVMTLFEKVLFGPDWSLLRETNFEAAFQRKK